MSRLEVKDEKGLVELFRESEAYMEFTNKYLQPKMRLKIFMAEEITEVHPGMTSLFPLFGGEKILLIRHPYSDIGFYEPWTYKNGDQK